MAALTAAIKTKTTYQKAIILDQPFSSVAWQAARDAGITNDIDRRVLMSLGHAYRALDVYINQRTLFLNHLYTSIADARQNPYGLRGWLSDLAGNASGVQERILAASRDPDAPLLATGTPDTPTPPSNLTRLIGPHIGMVRSHSVENPPLARALLSSPVVTCDFFLIA